MRALDPEEEALWRKVTATIRPLSRTPVAQDAEPTVPAPPPVKVRGRIAPSRAPAERPGPPPRTIHGGLDGHWERRLRAGRVDPDRVLDLHGHSLDSAWQAIDRGLERAIAAGDRVVLLITGHARPGEPPVARGKIRAAVHDWLAHSRHAGHIAAVRGAHRRHGGGGSLYLIIRR